MNPIKKSKLSHPIILVKIFSWPKRDGKAKEILIPYRCISEKTKLIQELFIQGDVYRRFKISIKKKIL